MKFLARFRQWIAEPLLERLAGEHARELLEARQSAFELGYLQGQAAGQIQGQQHLLCELSRFQDERRAQVPEVTEAGIERARKGILH